MPDLSDNTVFFEADASNVTGTNPGWPEGMAPSRVNDAARALQGAVKRDWDYGHFTVTSTGSANAYVLTYTTTPQAYVQGVRFAFIASFACTGNATVNINGLGAKSIFKEISGVLTNVVTGDILSNSYVILDYNGSAFVWSNRGGAGAGSNTFSGIQNIVIGSTTATGISDSSFSSFSSTATTAATFGGRSANIQLQNSSGVIKYASAYDDAFWNNPAAGSESVTRGFGSLWAGVPNYKLYMGNGIYTPNAIGADKGADSFNAKKYYIDGVDISIKRYVLAPQFVPAVSSIASYAHGLGAVPQTLQTYIICQTAELGYSVGEQFFLNSGVVYNSSFGFGASCDNTAITFILGPNLPTIINKSTFVAAVITAVNWRIGAVATL